MYLDYTGGINAYIFFFLKKAFRESGWLKVKQTESSLPWIMLIPQCYCHWGGVAVKGTYPFFLPPAFSFSHEQRNDLGHLFAMVLLLVFSACSPCTGIAYRIGGGSLVIFQDFLRLDGQFPALPWLWTRKAINSKHIRIVFPPGFYLQYGDLLDSCPFLSWSKFG